MKTIEILSRDYARLRPTRRVSLTAILTTAQTNPGFKAVIFLRLQQAFAERSNWRLAGLVRSWCLSATGADFVPGCQVGPGLVIQHPNGIVIGAGVRIGEDCTILQQVTLGEKQADGSGDHRYPTLQNGCVIGAGSKLLGGVNIGENVTIGANSVVLMDIRDNQVVAGVPAKLISTHTKTAG